MLCFYVQFPFPSVIINRLSEKISAFLLMHLSNSVGNFYESVVCRMFVPRYATFEISMQRLLCNLFAFVNMVIWLNITLFRFIPKMYLVSKARLYSYVPGTRLKSIKNCLLGVSKGLFFMIRDFL